MHLSREQIDYLMDFVKKHYVEWYDLQVEMVDHLANDIEEIMKKNPNITFQEALDRAFKKFGPMGFMDIAEKKQNALHKKYLLNIIREFKHFLFSYRFIYFILALILYYKIISMAPITTIIFSFFILILIPLIHVIVHSIKLRRKRKRNEKIYLVDSTIINFPIFFMLIMVNLFNFVNTFLKDKAFSGRFLPIFSFFFICCLWSYYFAFLTVPQKMESQTHELYEKLKAQA